MMIVVCDLDAYKDSSFPNILSINGKKKQGVSEEGYFILPVSWIFYSPLCTRLYKNEYIRSRFKVDTIMILI